MSQYPILTAGPLSVATQQAMVPDITVKPAGTDRTSTSMLNDPDLAGIALGVGTWEVEFGIQAATPTSNTQKIRTQWSFTGTWSNPLRFCIGPGQTNTAVRTDITPAQFNTSATTTDQIYGMAASSNPVAILEWSKLVVVTAAGTLALVWGQNSFSANATSVKAGSYCMVRQIA